MKQIASEELHIMLDLETLGTGTDSVITQFGWCAFQPCARQYIKDSGVYHINVESCLKVGMKMDWSTLQWWMRQSSEARDHFQKDGMLLQNFVNILLQVNWSKYLGVWSHGASFDIPILEHAFRLLGHKPPWNYKAVRDTRTLYWLSDPVWPDNPVKHSAMHDAIAQAGAVVDGLRKIDAAIMNTEEPSENRRA